MDYNNNSYENNSWESGIRFKEKRKCKKLIKFLAMILVIFFSASIGGILGGYYVKKNYTPSYIPVNPGDNDETQKTIIKVPEIPKNSITEVAEAVGPAVVGVNNNVIVWGEKREQGSGSGIIIDKAGYIVTNYHVIENANEVTVTLPGGKKVPAQIIGKDKEMDLAVLKINVSNLPVAKLGRSSLVRVGEISIAIGNPLGEEFAGSVTSGIISGVNREIKTDYGTYRYIQTDASINSGNSGGALCNIAGEVIGINTLKLNATEGMGFAIPIDEAKPIIDELIKNGYVSRPQMGVVIIYLDKQLANEYEVPMGAGIKRIIDGSPAQKAGLRAGDIIVEIDGTPVNADDVLRTVIRKHKVGDIISLKVWRNGKNLNLNVKLTDSGK